MKNILILVTLFGASLMYSQKSTPEKVIGRIVALIDFPKIIPLKILNWSIVGTAGLVLLVKGAYATYQQAKEVISTAQKFKNKKEVDYKKLPTFLGKTLGGLAALTSGTLMYSVSLLIIAYYLSGGKNLRL